MAFLPSPLASRKYFKRVFNLMEKNQLENSKEQNVLKFEDVQEKIMAELQKRSEKFGLTESVTLFGGFMNQPFCTELSDSFVLGGPTVPLIMLIGNETGRVYFLALKAVLEDLDI